MARLILKNATMPLQLAERLQSFPSGRMHSFFWPENTTGARARNAILRATQYLAEPSEKSGQAIIGVAC